MTGEEERLRAIIAEHQRAWKNMADDINERAGTGEFEHLGDVAREARSMSTWGPDGDPG